MYWQAYLHKTSLVAELMLMKTLKRAKELTQSGVQLSCSEPLLFFICNKVQPDTFDRNTLDKFAQLDDNDIVSALKSWQHNPDEILSSLSRRIINRDLFKVKVSSEKFSKEELNELIEKFSSLHNITKEEAKYFIFKGKIKNQAYSKDVEPIHILKKDKTIEDVIEASDQLNLKALSRTVTKYYICFPKTLAEK